MGAIHSVLRLRGGCCIPKKCGFRSVSVILDGGFGGAGSRCHVMFRIIWHSYHVTPKIWTAILREPGPGAAPRQECDFHGKVLTYIYASKAENYALKAVSMK